MSEDFAQERILSISFSVFSKLFIKTEYSGSATSSGKSIPAMIFDRVSKISFFISETFSPRTPERFFADWIAKFLVLAWIKSATASACERSIFLFKNALLVNSPRSAILAPFFRTISRIFLTTLIPPWQ